MRQGYRTEGMGKIFHVGHGNHEDKASWTVPHWSPKLSGLGGGYVLRENRPPQPTREEALFRIAQEALDNIGKHAKAHRVEVALLCEPGLATLTVRDDGVGFEQDRTLAAEQDGLDNMRSRVAEILGLPISCVSIKATTSERLGFTGRGEGIAAQAIASCRSIRRRRRF